MKMIKKRWGVVPPSAKHYKYIGQVGEHYGKKWSVWGDPDESSSGWRHFRLMVSGSILGRANYKISWNSNQLRFANGQDYEDLSFKRPALFNDFRKVLAAAGYIKTLSGVPTAELTEKRQEGKNWAGKNGFEFVGTLIKTDGVIWNIYHKPKEGDSEWENFNLCAEGIVDGRANYNLGWNGFRFATRKEVMSLAKERSLLFKRFLKKLKLLRFIAKDYEYLEKE